LPIFPVVDALHEGLRIQFPPDTEPKYSSPSSISRSRSSAVRSRLNRVPLSRSQKRASSATLDFGQAHRASGNLYLEHDRSPPIEFQSALIGYGFVLTRQFDSVPVLRAQPRRSDFGCTKPKIGDSAPARSGLARRA